MYRPNLESLVRSYVLVAAYAVLISSAGISPAVAEESYTPTMKDMLSIQGAIERYERGMDTRDRKLQESAFWDDAVIISPQGKRSFKQAMGGPPPPGAGGPPSGDGAPPPGDDAPPPGAGGPPRGASPGMPERPPSCDPKAEKPANGWALWHIVANSSFEFLSPTRVKHHAYWFAVCPSAGTANGAGIGSIGPPGSYNDILEKRNGEWRFVERNIALNEMYAGN
jgi:hypothetical protein